MLPPMPGLSPSCKTSLLTLPVEPFLLHGRVCLDIKRRASLRFRNVLGTRALVRPEERVKVDPVAVLYHCLKKSHKMAEPNSVLWWPQALWEAAVVMDCHMGGWPWGRTMSLGGWCCRRAGTSTGEQISALCSWHGWMKPHVTCCSEGGPFSEWEVRQRPPGSRHYFEDPASLSEFLTFCYLISSCPLLTEWLEDKSCLWQKEIKAFLFVFYSTAEHKKHCKIVHSLHARLLSNLSSQT